MATIAFLATNSGGTAQGKRAMWPAPGASFAAGDDGAPIDFADVPDVSVQVIGTLGGATVTIQGSNEDTPTNWATLTAPGGLPLSFTATGLLQVLENTRWIRPLVTGGTPSGVQVLLNAR